MITNERQYRITKAAVKRFEEGLAALKASGPGPDVHPQIHEAMIEANESQRDELREELERYDDLRSGRVAQRTLHSLGDLPIALIEARIAARLTQRELAKRLGVPEQQVQRWEANSYSGSRSTGSRRSPTRFSSRCSRRSRTPSRPELGFHTLAPLPEDRGRHRRDAEPIGDLRDSRRPTRAARHSRPPQVHARRGSTTGPFDGNIRDADHRSRPVWPYSTRSMPAAVRYRPSSVRSPTWSLVPRIFGDGPCRHDRWLQVAHEPYPVTSFRVTWTLSCEPVRIASAISSRSILRSIRLSAGVAFSLRISALASRLVRGMANVWPVRSASARRYASCLGLGGLLDIGCLSWLGAGMPRPDRDGRRAVKRLPSGIAAGDAGGAALDGPTAGAVRLMGQAGPERRAAGPRFRRTPVDGSSGIRALGLPMHSIVQILVRSPGPTAKCHRSPMNACGSFRIGAASPIYSPAPRASSRFLARCQAIARRGHGPTRSPSPKRARICVHAHR